MSKLAKILLTAVLVIIPAAAFAAQPEINFSEIFGQLGENFSEIFQNQEIAKISQSITKSIQSSGWLILASLFVAGAVLLPLIGRSAKVYAANFRKKLWRSLFFGSAIFVAPIIAVLLILTGAGLVLSIVLLLAWMLFLIVASSLSGFMLGALFIRPKSSDRYFKKLFTFLLGFSIIFAVGFIPQLGGLIQLAVFVISLGALALAKLEFYKSVKKAKLI